MRVAVIGAGVVGVTTAFELSRDGHEVTVFERHSTVAAEASFANAGLVAAGYVACWPVPGGARVRRFIRNQRSVRVGSWLDAAGPSRFWQGRGAIAEPDDRSQRASVHRLAEYSHERLRELTRTLGLDYERADGCLVLLRSEKELADAKPGLDVLGALGIRIEPIDAEACRAIEPGLNPDTPLHAGLSLPTAQVGNCREFTHLMRREAARLGARFRFGSEVSRIVAGRCPVVVYAPTERADDATSHGLAGPPSSAWAQTVPAVEGVVEAGFDAIVVCAGLGAPKLLRDIGLKLPLQAVRGHSLTAPLRQDDLQLEPAPRAAVVDERYKVTISRLGSRVRVAGLAEVGTSTPRRDADALRALHRVLHDWFPGAAQIARSQVWMASRPMFADGPPVLGPSSQAGVWLNLGHGDSGWALACGSARALADTMAGRPAEVDLAGLGIERLKP